MAGRVKCPICNAMNPLTPLALGGRVQHHYANRVEFTDAVYPVVTDGYPAIAVIECGGCRSRFVAHIYSDYRGESLWPLAGANAPDDVPEEVAEAYCDARHALAARSKIGALMAGRTTLIRMLRDKNAKAFKDLVECHIVTPALYGGADQLRLWADVVGHEDISAETIDLEEIAAVLDFLGTVLEAVYTHPARVSRFAAKTKELRSDSPGMRAKSGEPAVKPGTATPEGRRE